MFFLQNFFNIQDEYLEYRIYDSLTFHRFLELALGDEIPSIKAFFQFRKTIMESDRKEELFETFDEMMKLCNLPPVDLNWKMGE